MKKKIIYSISAIAIFGIMLIYFSSSISNKRVQKELSNLQASAYLIQDLKVYEKDSLPKPIKDYLPLVLNNKFNTQRMAEIYYSAESIDNKNKAESLTGKCFFAIYQPGFLCLEETSPFPLIWITKRDFYITGNSSILEKFMSIVTTKNTKGVETDQSGLMQYISGTPFLPWIFFNRSIFTYTSFDSSIVRGFASDNGIKLNVALKFENNKITELTLDNNLEADKNLFQATKLAVKYSSYRNLNGVLIPTQIDASWSSNEKTFNQIKYNITDYKFY
jgi:hypothetical protein